MKHDWLFFDDHFTGETVTLRTGEVARNISPNEWRIAGRCGYFTNQELADIEQQVA